MTRMTKIMHIFLSVILHLFFTNISTLLPSSASEMCVCVCLHTCVCLLTSACACVCLCHARVCVYVRDDMCSCSMRPDTPISSASRADLTNTTAHLMRKTEGVSLTSWNLCTPRTVMLQVRQSHSFRAHHEMKCRYPIPPFKCSISAL